MPETPAELIQDVRRWRHDLHRHPELAFAVDRTRQRCLVATDRFASVPVYYRRDVNTLVFATRLGLLWRIAGGDRELCSRGRAAR